jgi:hypothetical protein
MTKTSIYLEPELDIGLARVARERGLAKAELIRRSLRRVVEENPQPRITAIGIIADDDGPTDMSVNHDKYLAEYLAAEHEAL